ncbi:MAG: GAF domain-containing sensor histidine kinase [Candidatus Omnitrophica bacterium]|nr:GAF domain-containing sensor histidine kinase [Candidatus Omnitrophota bacterium]
MDIRIGVTRTTIFAALYSLVLGLPFAIAGWFKESLFNLFGPIWWIAPLSLMALLAIIGPFLYIYIERLAEESLLKEQRLYHETLKHAASGMTRIRNLRRLLELITHIVTKTVKISYAAIYLYDADRNEYLLQVNRNKQMRSIPRLSADNPLIIRFSKDRSPILLEGNDHKPEQVTNDEKTKINENMRQLCASVVIPSYLGDKLSAVFVLGDKTSGQTYTRDDLSVFEVLASQAALAIENARFYEEAKEMQEQIAQAEKMSTIGTMADGLSHQINNRFYALSLIAGDTIDSIRNTDTSNCSDDIKAMLKGINYALERIQANVIQGGEVVKGLLKYSRKDDKSFGPLELNSVIENTIAMVQYKIRLTEVDIIHDIASNTPKIKGNATQLQEVFFNFIDNAYDAIMERKTTFNEKGYRGKIAITARPMETENYLEITVEDNGIGVKEADTKKIFTPFFSTKVSSHTGTGLGLYVIKRIITETHNGKVSFESKYKAGTRFLVHLPVA